MLYSCVSQSISKTLPRNLSPIVLVETLSVFHPLNETFQELPIDFCCILVDDVKDSLDTGVNFKLRPLASMSVSTHFVERQ